MYCKKFQFILINRRVSKQIDVLLNSYFDIEWGLRKIYGDFEVFQIFGLKCKIYYEMVVEMYFNLFGYIYGIKDIDNMI